MEFTIQDVWQLVGVRSSHLSVRAGSLVPAMGPGPSLLLLFWPASPSYLRLSTRLGEQEFASDPDVVERMIVDQGIPRQRVPSAITTRRHRCLALAVTEGDVITVLLAVDTDDPDFLDDADAAQEPRLTREIGAVAVTPEGAGNARVSVGSLRLHLEPARPMRKYDGYVALDLGNTTSTLVSLDAADVGYADRLEVLDAEGIGWGAAIPTAIRFLTFDRSPADDLDRLEEADCLVGRAALEGAGGWLVLGAKRMLAEAELHSPGDLWLGDRRHDLRKSLPAELFVSEIFRAFHSKKYRVPRQIAITYPTTFSPPAIEQVRRVVVQGWRRSLGATKRSSDDFRRLNPPLPHLVIDEASATAFYFIYRDFLDAPGGLDMLSYLYPEGLNLLVFDCGGGTTDVALVHVRVLPSDGRGGRRTSKLTIEVLGRTGHRHFGGDDITIAAFRALKGRLASRLQRGSRLDYPPMPDSADRLPSWLAECRKEIGAWVPTEFNRSRLDQPENRTRMETTELLWRWAERFKLALGQKNIARVDLDAETMRRLVQILAANPLQMGVNGAGPADVEAQLRGIEIHREEIDVQVRDPLDQSIKYANRMITAKLGRPDAPGGEVHRVYVVGNTSRYPLVRERIMSRLEVSFLKQRLGPVHPDDLKNSVAKGAALALHMLTSAGGVDVGLDRQVNGRLPFDVTFWDPRRGGSRTLFREHDAYADLPARPLPTYETRADDGEHQAREVFLGRRWPGDDFSTPYLRFRFKETIVGPLTVWYDAETHRFRIRDEGGYSLEVDGEEIERAIYVAPVQSGKF